MNEIHYTNVIVALSSVIFSVWSSTLHHHIRITSGIFLSRQSNLACGCIRYIHGVSLCSLREMVIVKISII